VPSYFLLENMQFIWRFFIWISLNLECWNVVKELRAQNTCVGLNLDFVLR